MLRISRKSVRLVAYICRNRFSTEIPNPPSTLKEREKLKNLQKLSLLRDINSWDRWTEDDELQAQYIRRGMKLCEELYKIDLSDCEPLYQLNEDRPIQCRNDIKGEIPSRREVMSNSGSADGLYFVAPPIPATLVQIGTKDKKRFL